MASNLLIHPQILLYSDAEMEFFSDSLFPFSDSAIDILQAFSDNSPDQISVQNFDSLHHFSSSLLSDSPPSHHLESSTIYHSNTEIFRNGCADFSAIDGLEMKNEGRNSNSEPIHDTNPSFDDNPGFLFRPSLHGLMESASILVPSEKSLENSFFTGIVRKASSTGDMQPSSTQKQRYLWSSVASERSLMEELSLRGERYSAEERKERISKYRAKRRQRNFNKTIKYACRKTLADNRPRVRGRFARSDEPGESPRAASSAIEEEDDHDELTIEGWNQDEEERKRRRGLGESMNMEFNYYAS